MSTRNTLIGLVGAIVVAVIVGHLLFPSKTITQILGGATSPVNSSNAIPRVYEFVANGNGSYDNGANQYILGSINNPDAADRVIESIEYVYTGLGSSLSTSTANYSIIAATSTTATTTSSNTAANTNYVLNTTVSTSTATLFIASTTPGQTGTNLNRIWPAGSNLSFNANATTTSYLKIKISYLPE